MPGAGERAYGYAKTCGIIGKSFAGKRISSLREVGRISDLDRLLFPQSPGNLPEQELLRDLEARILQRSVRQIMAILGAFIKPPALLVRLIRSYEYGDMKGMLNALAAGEAKSPGFTDIGRFRRLAFEAYPNVEAMVKGTEFEGLLKDMLPVTLGQSLRDTVAVQTKIDTLYYTALWQDLKALSKRERRGSERILGEEIALKNAIWALRLRTYYALSPEEIREKFILPESPAFLAPAEAALSFSLDVRTEWRGWKYASLLNPENPPEPWRADPRYLQNAASAYLYRLAHLSFRYRPFTMDSFFCFIKMEQFEENLLTSIAEGLGMGMPIQDVFALLELPS